MARIVMKFGGTSVADVERIKAAAKKVAKEVENGHEVAVVVSAMSGVTNTLVDYCQQIHPMYDQREYDTVVSSGEQVTSGLMAMALHDLGIAARSWMGWQAAIKTDSVHGKARITGIDSKKMLKSIENGEVAVMAGFQGVCAETGRVTTLGRGGSDTSAVALASALGADRCDIYTDVDGVYTTDPRIVPSALKISRISYEEMLEMASVGAKVLQTRSVELAAKEGMSLQVLSSFEAPVGSDLPGTLVTREDNVVEEELVTGITYSRDDAKVTLKNILDVPGLAAKVFKPLADAEINVDMIVQNVALDGKVTDMTFTVLSNDLERAVAALETSDVIEPRHIVTSDKVAKISVIGLGMRSHAGVAQRMFETLADKNINIHVISTSEIKISVLIDHDYTELAVRALHTAYDLDDETEQQVL